MAHVQRRLGFTLIELLVVIAIIALLIGILLPAMGEAKRSSRLTKCLAKYQQIGVGMHTYAVSYQDKIVSFSWTRTVYGSSQFADLQGPFGNDLAASSAQAIDIIRRRVPLTAADMPPQAAWIPQILYNHLALVEDQDWKVATPNVICPEDVARNRWSRSWQAYSSGAANPRPTVNWQRWFASASYNFVPASMSPDSGPGVITNAGAHNTYTPITNPNVIGKRKLMEVESPAAKVAVFDNEARHFGKRSWHSTYPEAKQPLLFFDGHARTYSNGTPILTGATFISGPQRKGSPMNPGWDPRFPNTSNFFTYNYTTPQVWEAPLRNGTRVGSDPVMGYFRYTRGGLKGVDVESPESYHDR
jgi:prepilin-type N-terminal cleavage/methylation domain-containing protein